MNLKSKKDFTTLLDEGYEKFGGISSFCKNAKIERKQILRLYRGEPKELRGTTLNKLSGALNIPQETISLFYYTQFGNIKKPNLQSSKLKIQLLKIVNANDLFTYFNDSQIIEIDYEDINSLNKELIKTIYDLKSYFELTSRLIKEKWTLVDYFKFLPPSKYNFLKEREDEKIASLTFLEELQTLMDKLKEYKNYIFVNTFNRTYRIIISPNDSINKKPTTNYKTCEILKIKILDHSSNIYQTNETTKIKKKCKDLSESQDIIKEIEKKIYGDKFTQEKELKESAVSQWMKDDLDDYLADNLDQHIDVEEFVQDYMADLYDDYEPDYDDLHD